MEAAPKATAIRIHHYQMKSDALKPSKAFEEKGLASWSVNVGLKCSHGCTYCSTGTTVRNHEAFSQFGESPFRHGYAIVDITTPERVAREAARKGNRGIVQLCTTVDAWSDEARANNLGRACMEAILKQPGWEVRVLTKNSAVTEDFKWMCQFRDRIRVGLSLTATEAKANVIAAIEPNASPIKDRMASLRQAHELGLRTFGMLCPLLPGIASDETSVRDLVDFVLSCGAEAVFSEPVNARANCLALTESTLQQAGFQVEAAAIKTIR